MPKTVRTVVIEAPPQACYDVIVDFERYPEFVAELKAAHVLARGKDTMQAEFIIKIIKEITYSLDFDLKPPHEVRWRLKKGFFKKNNGAWLLKELPGGRTEATYEVELEFGLMVPGSVVKMLQETNLPKMLEAFKKRIEGQKAAGKKGSK
jgi:ribosome-associated toxin RatA of RatAB toxin-antitoxin module